MDRAVQLESRLGQVEAIEVPNRRTDDIAFNVYYLAENVIDREAGLFDPEAERDVLEQNSSDLGESDVHRLVSVVHQDLDSELGQYMSLGEGTMDNAQKGIEALDQNDPGVYFEYLRRIEEGIEEAMILDPEMNEGMKRGGKKVMVSPAPTHHEADMGAAVDLGYDDRTMIRIQELSEDGLTKTMKSFNLFDVPALAWAAYFSERYGVDVEPTALAVMRFCNQLPLDEGTSEEILQELINGVKAYTSEESAIKLERQLEGFQNDQIDLEQQTFFYAKERLELQKELALSLDSWARPAVEDELRNIQNYLDDADKEEIARHHISNRLNIKDPVIKIILSANAITTANRAGLATHNERTVKRVAAKLGLDTAIAMASTEHMIQQVDKRGEDDVFMKRRIAQMIAGAGLGCGGGCSVVVVDLFSKEGSMAEKAGLKGTYYESEEVNQNAKCNCPKTGRKAKVITDGSNVVCTTCGDFEVNGTKGNVKEAA